MKKQGAIVLGSGGDCCKPGGGADLSDGMFYEGCIVTGYPSDVTEDAVRANVVSAVYGKSLIGAPRSRRISQFLVNAAGPGSS